MKITSLLLTFLLVTFTCSFILQKNTSPLIQTYSNETGLFVKHINPSAPKMPNGQINFPLVISVNPSKVSASAIETAYVTV